MGVEIELKYGATPALQAQVRQAFPGQEHTLSMETVYYDTPTGALSALRYTLRLRSENGAPVCTVKTPAQVGRGEWNVSCGSITDAIALLIDAGAPEMLKSLVLPGLVPICGAKFTRVCKEITYRGCTAELAFDSGVLTGGGKELPLCEIEAELKDGDTDSLYALGRELENSFGLVPEKYSKFKRALGLAKGDCP